jgi:hypothetical protein
MGLFVKKPVVVEARQFPDDVDWRSEATHGIAHGRADWCGGHVRFGHDNGEPLPCILIDTLEGVMRADPGDWIVNGVQGEFYAVKPTVFAET